MFWSASPVDRILRRSEFSKKPFNSEKFSMQLLLPFWMKTVSIISFQRYIHLPTHFCHQNQQNERLIKYIVAPNRMLRFYWEKKTDQSKKKCWKSTFKLFCTKISFWSSCKKPWRTKTRPKPLSSTPNSTSKLAARTLSEVH